ncbi:NINE protein [Akkermansia muciniphila]|uniref:NINE protein n=1 Tax=Akkermansia muciniphila TaxID=239935 RepID=UPI003EB71725
MDSKQYYITLPDQTQKGPYDEKDLITRYQAGKYPKGTLVWHEGMDSWILIETMMQNVERITNDERRITDCKLNTPPLPAAIPPVPNPTNKRSNVTAGVFAIVLGPLGVHKFYNGSWGLGIIYLALCIIFLIVSFVGNVLISSNSDFAPLGLIALPFVLLHWIIVISSIIEGIMYLTNVQKYNLKYNETPPAPMK